jgi:hypothetical protein
VKVGVGAGLGGGALGAGAAFLLVAKLGESLLSHEWVAALRLTWLTAGGAQVGGGDHIWVEFEDGGVGGMRPWRWNRWWAEVSPAMKPKNKALRT